MQKSNIKLFSNLPEPVLEILYELPLPFAIVDKDEKIAYCNSLFKKLINTNGNLVGKKITDFFYLENASFKEITKSMKDSLFTTFKVIQKDSTNEKFFTVNAKRFYINKAYYLQLFFQDISLEYNLFSQLEIKTKLMEEELLTAKKILDHILYIPPIYNSFIRFETFFKPSTKLGGDFFDIFQIDENRIGVLIADVSGHGVSSSLITATFKMIINLIPKEFYTIEKMIYYLNSTLLKILLEDQFVTLFYGIIDTREYTIEYINCGHPMPLVYDEKEKKISPLKNITFPLSVVHEFSYSKYIKKEKIPEICKIFFYTDGLFSFHKKNEALTYNDLASLLIELYLLKPKNILNELYINILKEYDRFEEDDISMLLLTVNKNFAYKNHFSIPSNILEVDNAVINIIKTLRNVITVDEETEWKIYTALYEAIVNAIEHGNKNNLQKRVHITYRLFSNWLIFKVRDEGPGFKFKELPDPLDSKNILTPSGRGIYIIRKLMNKVKFNSKGNEITFFLQINGNGVK